VECRYPVLYAGGVHTHVIFSNAALLDDDAGDDNPGGEKLAQLIAAGLPGHGFQVKRIVQEDWGWVVMILNPPFSLWVGCGPHPDQEYGHLCFIEPGKPKIWRWLKRIDTTETISALAVALESIVGSAAGTTGMRWWSEDEARL